MVILGKIFKIGQLRIGEPVMHSGFFRLKHSYTIAEQEKLHIEGFLWQPSSKKKSQMTIHGDIVTRYADAGWVQTIKKISSQTRKEIIILIILGRFSINKTKKLRF
jgi:hypothetical protein